MMGKQSCSPWRIFMLSIRSFFKDDGPTWAAAIAYYALLSLFPLLLASASVASYFVDPTWATLKITTLLGDFLPKGQLELENIVKSILAARQKTGLISLVILVWTASLVFGTMTKALNIVFKSEKRYSYFKRMQIRLAVLLPIGVVFSLALSSSFLLDLLKRTLGVLPIAEEFFSSVVLGMIPILLLLMAFFLAYRFIPRRRPGSKAALIGATVSVLLFAAAKPLFLGYVSIMAKDNLVYGSLSGVIAAVVWAWVLSMIGIFGGQIGYHCQAELFSKSKLFLTRQDKSDIHRMTNEGGRFLPS